MNAVAPFKVLFLCTGNSARSIFGEYILRKIGKGAFETYSAGSHPRGTVNPYTLRVLLEGYRLDASEARSKPVGEVSSITFDFVITVCDQAKEACPLWPDQTIVAHWSSPDPAAFADTDAETYNYFTTVALQIQKRIELMCCLPLASLDRDRRERETRAIGEQAKLPGQK